MTTRDETPFTHEMATAPTPIKRKRALVVGCSDQVWQDVDRALQMSDFEAFYVCKLAGVHWQGGFFHWVTLHPEYMEAYEAERAKLGLPNNYEIIAPLPAEVGRHHWITKFRRISYRWPGMNASGSSGLFAVKAALDDGCDRVVLAGVPMTVAGKHFTRKGEWKQRDSFIGPWKTHAAYYSKQTRSLSGGWTEELLGAPTREWLNEP